jgi:hypothetical protein
MLMIDMKLCCRVTERANRENKLYTVSFGEIGLFDLIKNEYTA